MQLAARGLAVRRRLLTIKEKYKVGDYTLSELVKALVIGCRFSKIIQNHSVTLMNSHCPKKKWNGTFAPWNGIRRNGLKSRDGVKVLWCHSHLVCWFLGFHPYMCLFSFRKLFCDLFLLIFFCFFFLYCCLGIASKRKEVGGEAEGRCMVYKVW